uniref:DUF4729 domain-containing protein n=1 Tax=Clastoptera arizonana TaxID=38151 RepID=A0A1B6D131_9HEMI
MMKGNGEKVDFSGKFIKKYDFKEEGELVTSSQISMSKLDDFAIPAAEVAQLFQCVRCKNTPMTAPIHICPNGHQSCDSCYKTHPLECISCGRNFVGRNSVTESVLHNMQPSTALKLTSISSRETLPEEDLEQYDPMLLAKLERAHYEHLRNTFKANGVKTAPDTCESEPTLKRASSDAITVIETSRTQEIFKIPPLKTFIPLPCPVGDCIHVVTGSALVNHFEFEHSLIPIVRSHYINKYFKIPVNPSMFKADSVRCLGLFLVPSELPVRQPSLKNKIPPNPKRISLKNSMACVLQAAKLDYGDFDGSVQSFILVWASCLYENPPIYYTVQAVNTSEKLHSIKYCGSISSLHHPPCPLDVYKRGNCLVVTPGMIQKISHPSGTVDVMVAFHLFPDGEQQKLC